MAQGNLINKIYNREAVDKSFSDPNFIWALQELTPVGMRQHFILGRLIRKLYIEDEKFLSPTYNNTELYLISSEFNRTKSSLVSHLQGLYPP